jgi:hypothetical protein
VAKTLGVTVTHVYVVKHRIGRLVRKEVAALKNKPIYVRRGQCNVPVCLEV